MYQAKIFNGDWINKGKLIFERPVEIFSNVIIPLPPTGAFRILTLFSEPEPFRVSNTEVIRNQNIFNLILTYDEEIISSCKNAQLFLFGTTWINSAFYQNIDPLKKIFGVSFVCGAKKTSEGHLMRQKLWYRQKEIKIPKAFWISSALPIEKIDNNPTLPNNPHMKEMMFATQFHIAIENVKANNYFSEKLVDCFITKTIPIYWGCSNISRYFDPDGMFLVDSVEDIISVCNSLSDNDYLEKINYIERNYLACMKFCDDITIRLQKVINVNLFKNS